jgi:hypothetical protein
MHRQTLLTPILVVCVLNGIFSPYLNIAIPITTVLMPEVFPKSREWVLFFSSVFVATATLLWSGVPAALYERLIERDPAGKTSMYVWLGGAVLLSLPAIETFGRM